MKLESGKVRYLCQKEKEASRILYEEMFPEDGESFMDAYYRFKGKCNRILVLERDGNLVSMLHLNPYKFWMRGKLVDSNYIVAVATRPAYRRQGCMGRLLAKALEDLYGKRQPFTFLMPAKEAIYTPFGFRPMGNEDQKELAMASMEELSEKYDLFVWKDAVYWEQHIPEDEWEHTPMMVRIVHLRELLEHIGVSADQAFEIRIRIEDELLPENSGDFCWALDAGGSCLRDWVQPGREASGLKQENPLSISIADFGSFLFGAKEAAQVFAEVSPGTLEKLEKIRTLKKIFINESV